jgi:hypothetical protein
VFIAFKTVEEAIREAFKSDSHCVVAEDQAMGIYYVFTRKEWAMMYGTERTIASQRMLKGYKAVCYC